MSNELVPYEAGALTRHVTTERAHHPFSPSQLEALAACPAYEGRQSGAPHPRTVIGTISHAAIEARADDSRLTDEDALQVSACLAFYDERKRLMEAAGQGPVTEIAEGYLPIDDLQFSDGVRSTTAGYYDAALISADGTYAECIDYKLGFWPVTAARESWQARAYVLGLFKKYKTLLSIKFFFIQPNIEYISSHLFACSEIPDLHAQIQAIVAKARAARQAGDFAMAQPYTPICQFCKRIAECPKVAALAGEVSSKFAPLMVPADVTPYTIQDPARVKEAWQLASVVEAWAQAFRQHITNRVITGQSPPPPGYKLVSRVGNREIVDVEKYRNAALRRLTVEEYESTLKPSLTAVESMISLKAPRGQKTSAVDTFAEELEAEGAVARGEPVAFLKAIPSNSKSEA